MPCTGSITLLYGQVFCFVEVCLPNQLYFNVIFLAMVSSEDTYQLSMISFFRVWLAPGHDLVTQLSVHWPAAVTETLANSCHTVIDTGRVLVSTGRSRTLRQEHDTTYI